MGTELKPCPFCGGAAQIIYCDGWHNLAVAHVGDCILDGDAPEMVYIDSPGVVERMTAKWNRRPAPAQGALSDALERVAESWDGCLHDGVDIGECLRTDFARIGQGQVSDAAAYHANPVRAAQDIALAEAVRDAAALQYSGVDEPTEGEWSMVSNIRGMNVVELILAVRAAQAQGDAPGEAA